MFKKFNAFMLSLVLSLSLWPAALSAQTLSLPGTPGPSLGDFNTNLYTVAKAIIAGSGVGVGNALSVSQSSGQSNCTALGTVNMVHNVTTSASTGYVCLPAAIPGFFKNILNQTSQTIDIYGSASPNQYVPGTQDTINGTVGSTAFLLGAHQQAQCIVGTGGAWNCATGSNGSANPGIFTTLSASSTVSGAGFTAYFASPPAIGGTAPAAGSFTTLTASGTFSANGALNQFGAGAGTPGHVAFGQTTPPALSTCGTGAVVGAATDSAGEVHATGATACTVAFNVAYTAQPYCVATDNTTAAGLKIVYNSVGVSITVSGLTSGDTFSYLCFAQSGG
jgi:hypothetical protein